MLARIAAPPTRIAVNKSQVVTTALSPSTYCIFGSGALQFRWSRPRPQPIRASGGSPSLPRHPVTAAGHQQDNTKGESGVDTNCCGDRGISHHNSCGFLGMCPHCNCLILLFAHSGGTIGTRTVDSEQLRNVLGTRTGGAGWSPLTDSRAQLGGWGVTA